MPHVNSSGGDDLASTDEVKVYKDEGEEVEEKRSSENLSEDKLGLVTESEEGKSSDIEGRNYTVKEEGSNSVSDGKNAEPADRRVGFPHYPFLSPYPYHNGSPMLGGKMVPPPHPSALASLYMYNNEHFTQPPPAHMGIPPVHIDPKTGLPRHPMYAIPHPGSQFSHPLCGPDFPQWSSPPHGYPLTAGFRGSPYSPLSTSPLARFSPPGILPPHPGFHLPHPALVTSGLKQEFHTPPHLSLPSHSLIENNSRQSSHFPLLLSDGMQSPPIEDTTPTKKKPHIKKPLNAFMLFMKEMRATVIEECTLKESAAINQILGRKWHALDRSEQAKYYEMARKEKELHQQLYPGWSARDNYACQTKKKKRKREMSNENKDCANAKKCRARFGLDQQGQWCKPCRRKKKCIRFLEDGELNPDDDDDDDDDDEDDEDNENSVATVDSTTEGDSEMGSPRPPPLPAAALSTAGCRTGGDPRNNVQHSAISQSHSGVGREGTHSPGLAANTPQAMVLAT